MSNHPSKIFSAKSSQSGSILIFATWLLIILSIFAAAVGYQVRQRLRYIQSIEIREKLRAIADAGVQKAMKIAMATSSSEADYLRSRWADSPADFREIPVGDGSFTVSYTDAKGERHYGIVDEERKINLNKTKSQRVLAKVFELGAQIDVSGASDIAASIQDWIDADNDENAGGAESGHYRALSRPYNAKNAPLDNLEELMLIKGVTPSVWIKVLPFITLYSSGKININTASPEVLMSEGFSEGLARAVTEYRVGRDGKEGTRDDRFFSGRQGMAEEFTAMVRISDAERESLIDFAESGLLTVKSENFYVKSFAKLRYRKEALTLTCNFSRQGVISYCKEYYQRADSQDTIESHTATNKEA